ncbi:hypothetical protein GKE82_17255 [Conexibacter sp. W3-3-2]|uniref:Uncharacterized protein n=1 Tax=Paraconexibacter algicola TaxID=2133960 RepID=A0A2T4UKB0_9ACTN|nr:MULTISPECIES: hypothetical protein [Solirubrobacterales]MTD45987.1 hypothetical protein [Conexibacter sp. W3-3-2]PTL59647.1 hypothetical protein C7Y72_08290 [Paraconexibacter algicola]
MGLIPNPAGDLLKRVDITLANVDPVLSRVDDTLGHVDQTLDTVRDTLGEVSGTLKDATTTLGDVRELLVRLEGELALLHQVPDLVAKVDAIHAAVVVKS